MVNLEIKIRNKNKNGKGREYYSNGKLKYEGDYINGKKEGNGKFIDMFGNCYIGQFLNDEMNGKGKLFD